MKANKRRGKKNNRKERKKLEEIRERDFQFFAIASHQLTS